MMKLTGQNVTDMREANLKEQQSRIVAVFIRFVGAKSRVDLTTAFVEASLNRGKGRYSWREEGKDYSATIGVGYLALRTDDWWLYLQSNPVMNTWSIMVYGEPERAMEEAPDYLQADDFVDLLTTEYERLRDPFKRRNIPGKKKPRVKVAPGQVDVGAFTGIPMFGKPESGRKRKAK